MNIKLFANNSDWFTIQRNRDRSSSNRDFQKKLEDVISGNGTRDEYIPTLKENDAADKGSGKEEEGENSSESSIILKPDGSRVF